MAEIGGYEVGRRNPQSPRQFLQHVDAGRHFLVNDPLDLGQSGISSFGESAIARGLVFLGRKDAVSEQLHGIREELLNDRRRPVLL